MNIEGAGEEGGRTGGGGVEEGVVFELKAEKELGRHRRDQLTFERNTGES